jgi:hypothetical protein
MAGVSAVKWKAAPQLSLASGADGVVGPVATGPRDEPTEQDARNYPHETDSFELHHLPPLRAPDFTRGQAFCKSAANQRDPREAIGHSPRSTCGPQRSARPVTDRSRQ